MKTIRAENIPDELKTRQQWIVWRAVTVDGKQKKPPYTPHRTHKRADSTNPSTWSTFEQALGIYENDKFDGIGYVLTTEDGYTGVDLDHCIEDGNLLEWAADIVEDLFTYTELSPSGTGLHLFVRGELPSGGRKSGGVEMYDDARYLTVTGNLWRDDLNTIQDRQDVLNRLHTRVFGEHRQTDIPTSTGVSLLSDTEVLEKAKVATNAAKFSRLWDGDHSGYDSQSEADLALCALLAFYAGGDGVQIDRLFRQSGLMRDKWDTARENSTYGRDTIGKALTRVTEFYTLPKTVDLEVVSAADTPEETSMEDLLASIDASLDTLDTMEGVARDEGTRAVFALLAQVKDTIVSARLRKSASKRMGLGIRQYNEILKSIATTDDKSTAPIYTESGGCICESLWSKGHEITDPLCNFTANILQDTSRDDGKSVVRSFVVGGCLAGGVPLPPTDVLASKFAQMGWVAENWGATAIVRAGYGAKDKLREAIQVLSPNVENKYTFIHTGWREIDGKQVYLSASGGLGVDGISVELANELEGYCLPVEVVDPVGAMMASLRFLEIAPLEITVPIWSAVYLAPLSSVLELAFCLWLYGVTGTFKSTLAALALNHYGARFNEHRLMVNWWATPSAIEKYFFLAKDALMVIDDFRPEADPHKRRNLEQTAQRIIRHVGNRSGRNRMNADLSLHTTYIPRGLSLSTGEVLPGGRSIAARLFTIEMHQDTVNEEKLTLAQLERERYTHALTGYLHWLAADWQSLTGGLSDRRRELRKTYSVEGQHSRVPGTVADLYLGLELGLKYAASIGALSVDEAESLKERGLTALKNVAGTQAQRIDDEKPTVRFLSVIATLLNQQRIALVLLKDPERGIGGYPGPSTERIGWVDDEFVYLMPSAAYNRVSRYCSNEGKHFPTGEAGLRKSLKEENVSLDCRDGRTTTRVTTDKQRLEVIKLHRGELDAVASGKFDTWGPPT